MQFNKKKVLPTIKVYHGTGLVADVNTFAPNVPRRFIGFKIGVEGYESDDQPQDIPASSHYIKMVREGALICADKASATICGVNEYRK